MRNRYGYNCQVVNWGGFNEFTPAGYIEVVPGETIQGSISLAVRSQPTVLSVDTRAYVDAFAFYIPHRLTWDFFPQFITGQNPPSFPFVTNLFPFNFEGRYTTNNLADDTVYNANTPWLRGAYNNIWNQFFRRNDEVERVLSDNSLAYVSQRPSTLETTVKQGTGVFFNTQVGLAGSSPNQTLSLNSLRTSMALDRFGRMRAIYGNKYVDYLRALGVEVEWSLLDEPEVLGRVHKDWRFQRTSQTAPGATAPQNTLGQQAGMFYTSLKVPLKRTFIPEHGLIAVYVATRGDLVWDNPPQPPILCKRLPQSYWSPEYEGIMGVSSDTQGTQVPGMSLTNAVFVPDSAPINYAWQVTQYEEYRTGMNYNRIVNNGPIYALRASPDLANTSTLKYINPVQNTYGINFTQPTTQQYQVRAEYRLTRNSPVKRPDLVSVTPLK